MAYRILNDHKISEQKESDSAQVAASLKQGINALKGNFFDLETGGVNYAKMKGSEAYKEYQQAAAQLQALDLNSLRTQDARMAFWINLYNALVVHGISELNVENSVRDVRGFFENVAYRVGPHVFSLDDMEHGILRRNQKKHFFARKPFARSDPRQAFMVYQVDPRIHFCLVCGAKSCPPIGTYQEEKIEQQLSMAAATFVNSDNVVIDKANKRLKLSKILDWYSKDFGSRTDLLHFIARYRRQTEDQDWLNKYAHSASISWLEYDWGLNH